MAAKGLLVLPLVWFLLLAALPTSVARLSEVSNPVRRRFTARGGAQRKKNIVAEHVGDSRYAHSAPPGNIYLETSVRTSFDSVAFVAVGNLCLNILRPDPNISWQMKVPRILWEVAIMVLAKTATETATALPAIYLLLACVLISTALVDIFVWAPLYASFSHFESCKGGFFQPRICTSDYTKGFGRLLVVMQCIASGLFYLAAAITAMGSFSAIRDVQKEERHLRTMERWDQLQHQQRVIPPAPTELSSSL